MLTIRRRTATKLLRLHSDELARITARAEACGLSPARFIRAAALGATPKARHHADTDRLLRVLACLGGKLEQAMRHVRSSGDAELAERVAHALDGHRALVAQVVALRARRSPASPDHAPHDGSIGLVRTQAPANKRRADVSGDQFTIDFDPAGPAASTRLQAPAVR
jgi:hypothetical protein